MNCFWLKTSPSLTKGIAVINQLEDSRFEQFLRRIFSKIKLQVPEIFSDEEIQKLVKIFEVVENDLLLAIKSLVYIVKRLLKYIFMPSDLKSDLLTLGFSNEKSEHIVKLWSSETRSTLDELDSDSIRMNDSIDFTWSLNAELSSDYCKKTKVPKVYLTLLREKDKTNIEVTHPELYSMFLQFEAIQNDLDNIGIS